MKIVAFVPAKGVSGRIKEKNLETILGVPLFLWAANNLNRVLPKNDIYIDSESEKILSLAHLKGFNTIQRSLSLASNATNGDELMLWQASQVDADVYIQHLPPMVFLKEKTIRTAIEKIEKGCDSAFGVAKKKLYLWENNRPCYDPHNLPNSITLPTVTIEGMGFYVTTKTSLQKTKLRIGNNFEMIELDMFEEIDIDCPEDIEYARVVAKGLGCNSEYTSGIWQTSDAEDIKFLVLDVDGVLTDGGMYYTEAGDEFKKFNTKDGMAIKLLMDQGIQVGLLSSGFNKNLINRRADLFGIPKVYVGSQNKVKVLDEWLAQMNLNYNQVAYIGDDINDVKIINKVGLSACPSDAMDMVRNNVDVVLKEKGGNACVREFVEHFLLYRKPNA